MAGTDQVSFGPVPVLMVVKIIWSNGRHKKRLALYLPVRILSSALLSPCTC